MCSTSRRGRGGGGAVQFKTPRPAARVGGSEEEVGGAGVTSIFRVEGHSWSPRPPLRTRNAQQIAGRVLTGSGSFMIPAPGPKKPWASLGPLRGPSGSLGSVGKAAGPDAVHTAARCARGPRAVRGCESCMCQRPGVRIPRSSSGCGAGWHAGGSTGTAMCPDEPPGRQP